MIKEMGIMSKVEISEYCKGCAFLCKTDKEYCPNRMTPYEAQKRAEKLEVERFKNLYKDITKNR